MDDNALEDASEDSAMKNTKTRAQLEQRIAVLEGVCGEAYQLAGAVGAPEKALDNLSAAASGRPIPHDSFLPVSAADCDEFAGTPAPGTNQAEPGPSDAD